MSLNKALLNKKTKEKAKKPVSYSVAQTESYDNQEMMLELKDGGDTGRLLQKKMRKQEKDFSEHNRQMHTFKKAHNSR